MSAIALRPRPVRTRKAVTRLLISATAVTGVMRMAAAPAWARPPRGNYGCSYYYSTGGSPFFMGFLHIDSASKYHYTGAGHGRGRYTFARKRLTFQVVRQGLRHPGSWGRVERESTTRGKQIRQLR